MNNEFSKEDLKTFAGIVYDSIKDSVAGFVWMDAMLETFIASKKKPVVDWEVVSYVDIGNYKGQPLPPITVTHHRWSLAISSSFPIYSVKRLSDNEVFTLGEETNDGQINEIIILGKEYELVTKHKILVVVIKHRIIKRMYLSDLKKIKPVLFRTDDGVDITDKYHRIYIVDMEINWSIIIDFASNLIPTHLSWKLFSTYKSAREYVTINQPCLSVNDVKRWDSWGKNYFESTDIDSLKQFAEKKQNKPLP